jgi:uncharacterized protein (TIGR04255 family)
MNDPLPKFKLPPVTETALSVQFTPVHGYTAAHGGWFWKDALGHDWTTAVEAPRLPEIYARFGDDSAKGSALIGAINVSVVPTSPRLQFRDATAEHMIQIQDTRFAYNWSRSGSQYPSFDGLLPEFKKYFEKFTGFCRNIQNAELQLNQWEITYVNNFLKGDMWHELGDWSELIPQFFIPGAEIKGQAPNTARAEWQLVLGENRGRLHVSMLHARLGSPDGPEGLILQLMAHGPLGPEADLYDGFMCGHEAIVRTFTAMTSKAAHAKWQRIA